MTTKWLSHHGDPLEGLLRAANQQKKAGLKLFSIAEMNIWKKTRTYVVYFDQLSGAAAPAESWLDYFFSAVFKLFC